MRLINPFTREQPKIYTSLELEDRDVASSQRSQKHPTRRAWNQGWRGTVLWGVIASSVVLITNISILAWAEGLHQTINGDTILYNGDCSRTRAIGSVWHVLINILSTLLLAASNGCIQVLSSLCRTEIDCAHGITWVHIGLFSKRNWKFVTGRSRKTLILLLVLSSVPLHLLYNTVVYTDIGNYDYISVVVGGEFFDGPLYNNTQEIVAYNANNLTNDETIPLMQRLARNNSLQFLTSQQCISAFSQEVVSKYGGVVLATSSTVASGILDADIQTLDFESEEDNEGADSWGKPYIHWICSGDSENDPNCDPAWQQRNESWTVGTRGDPAAPANTGSEQTLNTVDHCLAKEGQEHCSVLFNRNLMISVIVCNIIKLSCLVATLLLSNFNPLVTVGDAISSFLAHPDPNTRGLGPVSCVDVRSGKWQRKASRARGLRDSVRSTAGYWSADVHRHYLSMSGLQWVLTCICSIGLFVFAICLVAVGRGGSWSEFGSFNDSAIHSYLPGQSVEVSALIANMPQLLISCFYLVYNSMLTAMTLTVELTSFAKERKTLRVSNPSGNQRSTYWLSLPYRYAIPFITSMALLHWLISESVFLIQITEYDSLGTIVHDEGQHDAGIYGVSWSPPALVTALVIGFVMFLILIALSTRKYPNCMPVLSSCSAAISAACHRTESENADMNLLPLQYGVLTTSKSRGKAVGFSSLEVSPLEDGELYTGSDKTSRTNFSNQYPVLF